MNAPYSTVFWKFRNIFKTIILENLLSSFNKGAFTYDVRCFGGIFDLPT